MDIDARNLDALRGEDEDALKELKHFLFKETVRIENEKKALKEDREKLIRERTQFRKEIDLLNHKMVLEHKRLKDENGNSAGWFQTSGRRKGSLTERKVPF